MPREKKEKPEPKPETKETKTTEEKEEPFTPEAILRGDFDEQLYRESYAPGIVALLKSLHRKQKEIVFAEVYLPEAERRKLARALTDALIATVKETYKLKTLTRLSEMAREEKESVPPTILSKPGKIPVAPLVTQKAPVAALNGVAL